MKSLALIGALAIAPHFALAADFNCICTGSSCLDENKNISVQYEPTTLFFSVKGPRYTYKGYVTSQTSEATGVEYLTLPSSYTFNGGTITVKPDGGDSRDLDIGGELFHCQLKK